MRRRLDEKTTDRGRGTGRERVCSLCPEVDVASQGGTVAEARANLEEALALFRETAATEEVERRLRSEVHMTHVITRTGLPPSEFE